MKENLVAVIGFIVIGFVTLIFIGLLDKPTEPTLTPVCAEVKTLGQIRAEAARKLGEGKPLDYTGEQQ